MMNPPADDEIFAYPIELPKSQQAIEHERKWIPIIDAVLEARGQGKVARRIRISRSFRDEIESYAREESLRLKLLPPTGPVSSMYGIHLEDDPDLPHDYELVYD